MQAAAIQTEDQKTSASLVVKRKNVATYEEIMKGRRLRDLDNQSNSAIVSTNLSDLLDRHNYIKKKIKQAKDDLHDPELDYLEAKHRRYKSQPRNG